MAAMRPLLSSALSFIKQCVATLCSFFFVFVSFFKRRKSATHERLRFNSSCSSDQRRGMPALNATGFYPLRPTSSTRPVNRHQRRNEHMVLDGLTSTSHTTPPVPLPWTPEDPIVDPEQQDKLLRLIQSDLQRLEGSHFYRGFLLQLHDDQVQDYLHRALGSSGFNMVVYGIGSLASSSTESPRLQLALALLLRNELKPRSVELFDPVLNGTECAVAAMLGFTVMTVNERGRREVTVPTLFYMPHCDIELYDALLETNWHGGRLSRMVVLGNGFAGYERFAVRFPCGAMQKLGSHVLRALSSGLVRELDIRRKEPEDSWMEDLDIIRSYLQYVILRELDTHIRFRIRVELGHLMRRRELDIDIKELLREQLDDIMKKELDNIRIKITELHDYIWIRVEPDKTINRAFEETKWHFFPS